MFSVIFFKFSQRQFLQFILCLSALLFNAQILAADFFIELIVFRHGNFQNDLAQIAPEEWNAGADESKFALTTTEMRRLADKLNNSMQYKVLTHKAFNYSFAGLPQSVYFTDGKTSYKRSEIEGKIMLSFAHLVEAKLGIYINEFDVYGVIFRSEAVRQTHKLRLGTIYYLDQANLGVLIKIRKYGN